MATKKATSSAKKSPTKKTVKTSGAETKPAKVVETKKVTANNNASIRPSALIAEFLGTFLLAGAVITLAGSGVENKLAIMFALVVIVIVFGVVSGAHLNPAITFAVWANRKIGGLKAVAYMVAQVLGALLAYVVLKSVFDANLENAVTAALATQGLTDANVSQYGANSVKEFVASQGLSTLATQLHVEFISTTITAGKEMLAFWTELLGSVVFGLGIGYAVLTKKSQLTTSFAVGGALLLGLTIGGATVILNPAVAAAIGAFSHGDWSHFSTILWPLAIYVVATFIGMTAGFTAYRLILRDTVEKEVA